MSPDERLQQIARLIRDGSISREDVAWLIDEVVRLNSENARQTDKITAIRERATNAEDGGFPFVSVEWLRARLGPR